jgi:cyanate permease
VDTLSYLRALDASHDIVSVEIDQIKEDIRQRNLATSQGWTVLFTSKPLFERLWRVALLHFMAQMCGNTSMKYYLPDIFMALGMSRRISLMISGIETTMKIACTLIEAMIVDRLGRRITLVAACVMMTFALMVFLSVSAGH